MEFYGSVFETTIETMQTFADGPESSGDIEGDRVMHASMSFENGTMMASDTPQETSDLVIGGNFSLSLETKDSGQTDNWLQKLSADGEL